MKNKGMVKVVESGYTVSVTSWENDGDHYQTNSITVGTLAEAEAIYNLMQLCTSENNTPKGVVRLGNACGFNGPQIDLIIDFLKNNPVLYEGIEFEFGLDDDDDADAYMDIFHDLSYDLLGASENFSCRVMEECVVTYSPEAIYAERIF